MALEVVEIRIKENSIDFWNEDYQRVYDELMKQGIDLNDYIPEELK